MWLDAGLYSGCGWTEKDVQPESNEAECIVNDTSNGASVVCMDNRARLLQRNNEGIHYAVVVSDAADIGNLGVADPVIDGEFRGNSSCNRLCQTTVS